MPRFSLLCSAHANSPFEFSTFELAETLGALASVERIALRPAAGFRAVGEPPVSDVRKATPERQEHGLVDLRGRSPRATESPVIFL
jgi:hypothetical protein